MDSSSCDIYQLSSHLRSRSLGRSLELSLGSVSASRLPKAVIFLIVKLRRGFSQLSFVCILFPLNIFLIIYFCVVSSFEPPLDHNSKVVFNWLLAKWECDTMSFYCGELCTNQDSYVARPKILCSFGIYLSGRLRRQAICPVRWGYRIHRLLLCKEVRLLQRVSWYETKQCDSGDLGNTKYLFIAIAPSSTLIWSGSIW